MTLTLHSTHTALDGELKRIANDSVASTIEFQQIRDTADQQLAALAQASAPSADLAAALRAFQDVADATVEALQKVALAARKGKLADDQRALLKSAIEHQVAYIVVGYQSSVEKL